MRLSIVTSNPGKFREIAALLHHPEFSVQRVDQRLPEPQADSLEAVVAAKLEAVRGIQGPTIVEDTGLFVPGLGGFPGVYSSYVYRTLGLRRFLAVIPGRTRAAYFQTVAGVRTARRSRLFEGVTQGTIVRRPRGTHGFGFDPVFRPRGQLRTLAELSAQEKNRLSARGKAIRAVRDFLLVGDGVPRRNPERKRKGRGW